MQFDVIWANIGLYGSGILTTLQLLVLSLLFGLLLSVPLAVLRVASKWAGGVVWLYTYVIRGTPMLVQLYLIYYGVAQFELVRDSWAWEYLQSASFCACLAFIINTSAYTTEMLVGAIKATHHGEVEAAKAMGMSRALMFRRILLPSALRRALPAYSNEVIMMLHGTSLASIVTLMDITGAARKIYSQYYLPFEAFIAAGVIYLCFTFLIVKLFKKAEGRWLAHMQPRKA
ncbi:ABC transporter permease [Chitinivorax sp. B]|uniref:ABC transporter permease n=1 Tax=Chitinivorax sp. B TaxID=2502235 RepID=UPI0010F5F97A|nr:ABC transporter permease [Chitinivorax sp. B]